MSAAVSCAELGLRCILIEKERELGGQLLWTYNPLKNFLGIETADGRELAQQFAEHVMASGVRLATDSRIVRAELVGKRLTTFHGEIYEAQAIIVATGVRRRRLGIPGEDEFIGRGILTSGIRDKHLVCDKIVLIAGGGDAAIENALILSTTAREVIVIHRGDTFRARRTLLAAARRRANIRFLTGAKLLAITGSERVRGAAVLVKERIVDLSCDHILIRIGVEPNIDLLVSAGFFAGDGLPEGVLVAGDVSNPSAMTVANAVGEGNVAALNAFRYQDHLPR